MMTRLAILAILTTLTACDRVQKQELREERHARHYQEAMADYSAGRLDAAAAGFEKVLRADPANASARFQLACLLQDRRQDYLGALCNYREYLLQAPDGDKAKLAKDRAAICEKLMTREMAKRLNLADASASVKALTEAQEAAEKARQRMEQAERALAEIQAKNASLIKENARLRRMVASVGDEPEHERMKVSDVKDLLEDAEEDRLKLSPDAKALFDEEERADRSVAEGARAAEAGLEDDGPTLLDHREGKAPEGPRLTDLASSASLAGTGRTTTVEPPHEERPEFYVVQEGDTLYRLALRFYGRRDAWVKVKDANKALISNDGRIKVGQKLRLP